ncbi:UPF0149 family protein [Glaciecola sp. 1036]|uniref:UPF0149 family protein n=1 Tax=Alteromonadaceae TaxID=72275 RepID=UPI003D080C4D
MSDTDLQYDELSNQFAQQKLLVDVAEVHGILCGMLAGGMSVDNQDWITALEDVVNQGDVFSSQTKQIMVGLFNRICQEFIEPDFALTLFLPDDSAPINDRGKALVLWVQGFLLGFGLHQSDFKTCSDEVKEALEDFSQIARMDEDMSEGEDNEQALFEVVEYVRISAMLCFNELGKSLLDSRQHPSSVIH